MHCAANSRCARTCDCLTNGKWKLCETGSGTANCLAIQVFFLELFFEETWVECAALIKLQSTVLVAAIDKEVQESREVNPFTVQVYTILITAFVYQTS
jgi:hypothetical protein